MALIIVSVINLQKGKDVSTNETLLHVASAIIALAWVLLAVWSLWSLGKTRSSRNGRVPSLRDGMLVSSVQTRLIMLMILTL